MLYNNSKCQLLGNIQDGSTASLSIQSAEETCFTINLQCNLTIQPMCTVLDDAGISIYEATTTSEKYQQSEITSIKQSTGITSEVETQSELNNAEWTSTYTRSFLEYIVSTSVVFGILVLIIFDIWICKKVKEANKRKRNVSSPRNNVSHSQPCENVLNSVEYDEVNPNGMIDMTFPPVIDITVIEENND
ncbi:unnamed protein product [Mytilus edulis]|uniref:Uncharacterized protein n=1 Tax=Mytilus edulis TaxID=6550 RepID=A0A8S3SHN1_MYTED|nr:unnamed protein product [Mytilus edulis]